MRYRQKLVNCVSECLCREISRALMIGNSLGLTTFAFPTKPGLKVTLAEPEKLTLAAPPNALARLPLALCPPSIRETRELSACRRWSIPEMRPRKLTWA
jgi:hypothetical protein